MASEHEPALPTQAALRAKPSRLGNPLRWFCALCALVALTYIVRQTLDDHGRWLQAAILAIVLCIPSLACAWLAQTAWRSPLPTLLRGLLALPLVYHALFGPSLLLTRAIEPVSSNDDLVMRLWPHVVHAIDSFE